MLLVSTLFRLLGQIIELGAITPHLNVDPRGHYKQASKEQTKVDSTLKSVYSNREIWESIPKQC